MKLLYIPVLTVFLAAFASGEITVSKDSLWVSNSPMFSRSDAIVICSSDTVSVMLDSAIIVFEQLDTTGLSFVLQNDKLQMIFSEQHGTTSASSSHTPRQLMNIGDNRFRMQLEPSSIRLLEMSSPRDTIVVSGMEIGSCFICDRMPIYPLYLRGVLYLFFSNHQVLGITLYSTDLRSTDPKQGISVSKDSLQLYNNLIRSWTDQVILVNNGPAQVRLDSAFVTIDELDTSGLHMASGTKKLEVRWRERFTAEGIDAWDLEPTSENRFRLIPHLSAAASTRPPLSFSGPGDTLYIAMMMLGTCLDCSGLPAWLPPWVSGTLELRFTNGQTVGIRLFSEDLRTVGVGGRMSTPPIHKKIKVSVTDKTVSLYLTDGNIGAIGLFDASGRCATAAAQNSIRQDGNRFTIPTTGLRSGIYYLHIRTTDSRHASTRVERILLQH